MTLGTDPEFLVQKGEEIVPFLDYIGEPVELEGFVTVSVDNVLLEINTIPAHSAKEFREIHEHSLQLVSHFIGKNFGLSLSNKTAHTFNDVLDFRFFEVGCTPSWNVYTGQLEHPSYTNDERFCGGHIHIGYDGESKRTSQNIIKNMDYYVGQHLDEIPTNRRKVYGKAGEFRRTRNIKVEYRTPSNEWILQNKYEWIWEQAEKALEDAKFGIVHEIDPQIINQIKVVC